MLRLRPYKSCDSAIIAEWIKDRDVFLKWGGDRFGEFPISAKTIDEKYRLKNGDCSESDNFYPWVAFDDENGVVGHFIMRYIHGDNRILRFGWVIVDNDIRGKGYGTEMLRLGLKYAFEIMGAEVVTIGVFANNDRAHNCYRKVGFTDKETGDEGSAKQENPNNNRTANTENGHEVNTNKDYKNQKAADDQWKVIEMEIDRAGYIESGTLIV